MFDEITSTRSILLGVCDLGHIPCLTEDNIRNFQNTTIRIKCREYLLSQEEEAHGHLLKRRLIARQIFPA